ncbi:MAG: hypothetical protein AAF544_08230 [Bacteroidota bacterium]
MRSKFLLVCLAFTMLCLGSTSAQFTTSDARDDLDYYNQDRSQSEFGTGLWWGGGFQLGFVSDAFQSVFAIGVSPIVGYKVLPWLSFGPRGSILYNNVRFRDVDENSSFFTYSAGLFGRAKAFQQFFAHVEYNLENDVIGFNGATLDPIRRTRGVPYVGAGYTQGGGFQGGVGFEIMILFPIVEREFITDQPYIIRSGINVNF